MYKTKTISFIIGAIVGILSLVSFVKFISYYQTHMSYGGPKPGTQEYEDFKKAHPSPPLHNGSPGSPALLFPADISNDQILLGASHNVFVGKVVTQSGNKETEIGPRTQNQVQVIDNIKGELRGVVTLDMLGGYGKDGKLILVEDESSSSGNSLLQVGSTYLFATRYNQEENWYTLIAHPNARKILSTDANVSVADLKVLARSDRKFKTWEEAFPEEILDKADVASNNTRNAFKTLDAKSKAAAQSRADEAKASLAAKAQ